MSDLKHGSRAAQPCCLWQVLACVTLTLTLAPPKAWAGCAIVKRGELPVTMNGLRPMVHAQINGQDALFLADSGAFYSSLTTAAAAQYKLAVRPAPFDFWVDGTGGDARAWVTRVDVFTILNVQVPKVDFLVLSNDLGSGAAGLLGQNVFRVAADVEYDLANGVIRLMSPRDCDHKTPLAYWASASLPFSSIDIEHATPMTPHTRGDAYVNGTRIRVMFDTGAATSVMSLNAAKRAGITPDGAGVVNSGLAWGIGPHVQQSWIGPFASFKIGDEEVRNTRLRFAPIQLTGADMLVGADFFLSHRVYVANSQRKLYFTYNGGPVFNLTQSASAADNAPKPKSPTASEPTATEATPNGSQPATTMPVPATLPSMAAAASAPAASTSVATVAGEPVDAAGFSRRGAAFAARRDYASAIADFNRACELAPTEATYFYQRAMAYSGNKQPDRALTDLDQALKLGPHELSTLLARAQLHAAQHDNTAAIADLDAADRVAAPESETRRRMGELYEQTGEFASAVRQYTLWINTRSEGDVAMAVALNARCWARALWGQELDSALADCNAALRLRPDMATALEGRGLVWVRRGDYNKAITDYDRSLNLRHNQPWALYGRGVAKLRKGRSDDGEADIQAAKAVWPDIAARAAKRGITP